ncbi:MAG: ABC transporter ATP-binding protein [Planctomycetes bacterium]|nr:ABC transporter ATP-binding protein [Planctomycetota bacterium]
MIEVNGLTKYYGSFKALDGVSFHVDKGEVLGFLGPNGAGKSTTMKILTTFISASEGTASVNGFDVHVKPQEVRRRIGYLPESPPLYTDMIVEEYLTFAGQARGLKGRDLRERLDTVIEDLALRTKRMSLISELSKGFKQRVGIAQALIHDPEVLILDEPTSGLDPRQIIEIRKLIDHLRENKIIIFSTHILQEATAVASRLVIINNGKVVADGTADELAHKASGRLIINITVKAGANPVRPVFEAIPQIKQALPLQSPTGYERFELTVDGGIRVSREVCESLTAKLVGDGFSVAEMAPQQQTLEQVFLSLLDGKPAVKDDKEEDKPKAKTPPANDGEPPFVSKITEKIPKPDFSAEQSTIIAPPTKEEAADVEYTESFEAASETQVAGPDPFRTADDLTADAIADAAKQADNEAPASFETTGIDTSNAKKEDA